GQNRLFVEALPSFAIEERALHQAIFQRMEADERGDAGGTQQVFGEAEQCVQLIQLRVDGEAQRLKFLRRRIDTAEPPRSDRAHDGASKLERIAQLTRG